MIDEHRLYALDLAIEQQPEAPVNYLLRGEYWLEMGEPAAAQRDLLTALDLAEKALAASDWGYIYQSYIDRAESLLVRLGRNETLSEKV